MTTLYKSAMSVIWTQPLATHVQFIQQAITHGGSAHTIQTTNQKNVAPLPFCLDLIIPKLTNKTTLWLPPMTKQSCFDGTIDWATSHF